MPNYAHKEARDAKIKEFVVNLVEQNYDYTYAYHRAAEHFNIHPITARRKITRTEAKRIVEERKNANAA